MYKKYDNKILLVDDDTKNLQVAMNILKNYNVIYAQNGEKAFELLEKNNFDLNYWFDLKEKGAITSEEYEKKKNDLLLK